MVEVKAQAAPEYKAHPRHRSAINEQKVAVADIPGDTNNGSKNGAGAGGVYGGDLELGGSGDMAKGVVEFQLDQHIFEVKLAHH